MHTHRRRIAIILIILSLWGLWKSQPGYAQVETPTATPTREVVDGPGGVNAPEPQIPAAPLPQFGIPLSWPIFQPLLTPLQSIFPAMTAASAPLLQWAALILGLLLLLFLLWRLVRWLLGRTKSAQRPVPPPQAPPPTVRQGFQVEKGLNMDKKYVPDWIKNLSRSNIILERAAEQTEGPLQDSLIIGLGPAGREVLNQVAQILNGRYGTGWPENIRLLQVDVQVGEGTVLPPSQLRADQCIVLRPNQAEVRKNLNDHLENYRYLDWYAADQQNPRAQGRMAFFYDLMNGSRNSRLWTAVQNSMRGLNKPLVKVVGTTFDEVSSGMLVDICRLVQITFTQDVDVQLWLCGPLHKDWNEELGGRVRKVRPEEQKARTLATLRELERFQRNAPVLYQYVPPSNMQDVLRETHSYATVQTVFVFEPKADAAVMPEDDVFSCMADSLLALFHLNVQQNLAAHFADRSNAGSMVNRLGMGMVAALGSYSVRVPQQPLEQALAWRMVRDLLFEASLGMLPLEKLRMVDGAYEALDEAFLDELRRKDIAQRNAEADKLVARLAAHQIDFPRLMQIITIRLNNILNGTADNAVAKRRAGIVEARAWLDSLNRAFRVYQVRQGIAAVADLLQQLELWQAWLKDRVYPEVQNQVRQSCGELSRLKKQTARTWALDEKLEWPAYLERVRRWADYPSTSSTAEALVHLGQRFGWFVIYNSITNRWSLQWIIPPGDFEYYEGEVFERYAHSPEEDLAIVLNKIYQMALQLVHNNGYSPAIHLAQQTDANKFTQGSAPRLSFNGQAAASHMGSVDRVSLLVASPGEKTDRLVEKLKEPANLFGPLQICAVKDESAVTVLSAVDRIPMLTSNLFDADAWQNLAGYPKPYVWRAEQIAADYEESERLSARFVGWLGQDAELVQWFAMGYVYGCFVVDEYGMDLPQAGFIKVNIPGQVSPGQILDVLFGAEKQAQLKRERQAVISAWRQAVETAREGLTGQKQVFLRRVEREIIAPLRNNGRITDCDFAIYLQGMLRQD